LMVRYRIQVLSEVLEGAELEMALHERWAEGAPPDGHGATDAGPVAVVDEETPAQVGSRARGEQPAELVP
ncbi:MAG TPA: hypothetical protein VMQ59_06500, partial [Acidimicrobiales bacterium]|nr:hypothetical protein [Acidimicrobiales bacterium]